MFVKFSWILAAPATLAMIAMATASAQTPNVAAQTPASESSSLQEMEQEVDGIHQESRELGGDPSSLANLWPEGWDGAEGAHAKDKVENLLHERVCRARTSPDARLAIARTPCREPISC